MKRSASWAFVKPIKENLGWKPVKIKRPDPGSYDPYPATKLVKPVYPNYSVPKAGSQRATSAKSTGRKYSPGAGAYNIEKCYNVIARPYMKKRC